MYKLKSRPEDFVVKEELEPRFDKNGDFACFRMRKKGYSTEDVMRIVERVAQIPSRFINYSGLKDKHAVTEQLISVRHEFKGRINSLKLKDISFEYIGLIKDRLSLGQHSSNRFEITVRNIRSRPEVPTSIPNYFDEQRFSKNNAAIGLHLVKKEFEEAVKLLSKSELSLERSVREAYARNPNDPLAALRTLPKRILLLYVHAYQSLLFNKLLGLYVERASDDYWIMPYSKGSFYFPKDRITDRTLPIIGFSTDSKLASELLEEEGIKTRDFIVRSLPELSSEGSERTALIALRDAIVGELEPDELNKGTKKCVVSFSLGAGCYATMVIRAIFGSS